MHEVGTPFNKVGQSQHERLGGFPSLSFLPSTSLQDCTFHLKDFNFHSSENTENTDGAQNVLTEVMNPVLDIEDLISGGDFGSARPVTPCALPDPYVNAIRLARMTTVIAYLYNARCLGS